MSGLVRLAWGIGIACLTLAAALGAGWLAGAGAWLAWRGAAAVARGCRAHPIVPVLLLVLVAGLVVRGRRRRALRRAGEAGLLVLHRLWANLDAVSDVLVPAARGTGQPAATLLPLLEDVPKGLAPELRERLARTDALLGQLCGLLPESGAPRAGWAGRGDLRLRQALARDVMQAMLEDFAVVAGVAMPSAVAAIAGAQDKLRQARAQRRPVATRITVSEALLEGGEGALLLCWRQDQAPPGVDVVALGG